MQMKVFSRLDEIPSGTTDAPVTPGTLVLEGGAWRGLYTQGALDTLMQEGILFKTTIGVSAGAMSALGYLSGQIGWAPKVNLSHRYDSRYCGLKAVKSDHGVIGFTYLFGPLMKESGFSMERLMRPERDFYAVATDVDSGETVYFKKGECDILRAVRASATVPYVSRPVVINGHAYLDGGCSTKIPYTWAKERGDGPVMVIRTQHADYRKGERKETKLDRLIYGSRPRFIEAMVESYPRYNATLDEIDRDVKAGRTFLLAPSEPVTIHRFEKDVEKLGALYELGRRDMAAHLSELKIYFETFKSQTATTV